MSVGGGVMAGMETFTLVPRGPFSLAASIGFLEGFTPASYSGAADGVLELAFPVEGSWRTVGVRVRQDGADAAAGEMGTGPVRAEIVSPAAPGSDLMADVRPQVERILSLDVDGSGFPAVGERDPVVGEVQRRYPGLRPVGFWSPYEAAAWTIIGHRIRITQAAAIKARIAERLGQPVSFGGRVVHAFPSPQRLRAMPHEEAMADLRKLPGIGDFSAGLTLLRGAGAPDAVPGQEPRLARAVALAYGLAGPAGPGQLREISENWRPYRTWVTLLMRTALEDETGEITGRQGYARRGVKLR